MKKQSGATLQFKNKWSLDEDILLARAVASKGTGSWNFIAKQVPGRTGKQCRERWLSQLQPGIVKEEWTSEEDDVLIKSQQVYGNKWSLISRLLPGRSAVCIKNRWNLINRRKHNQKNKAIDKEIKTIPEVNQTVDIENPVEVRKVFLPSIQIPNSVLFGPEFESFRKQLCLV